MRSLNFLSSTANNCSQSPSPSRFQYPRPSIYHRFTHKAAVVCQRGHPNLRCPLGARCADPSRRVLPDTLTVAVRVNRVEGQGVAHIHEIQNRCEARDAVVADGHETEATREAPAQEALLGEAPK